jgi:FixJ family two-component response regulator
VLVARLWPTLMRPETVVAIIEDDPEMLKAIGRLLRMSGFRLQPFASAEAFLARDREREPDCLVLDIHLGGMSGIELRHHLKAAGSQLPIIFITAVNDEVTLREATQAGCVAFLRKPFPSRVLIDAINAATTQSKAEGN